VLSVRNLSKTFSGQKVLDGVDLEISAGSVHALLGENGSGKSTLIKCLAGYHRADPGGEVTVDGVPLTGGSPTESARLGMRFVHQNLGLIDEMSVLDNLSLTSDLRKPVLARARAPRAGIRGMAKLGMHIDLDRPVAGLSALERAAIAIGRAVDDEAGHAKVLVLDEPTAAMSPGETDDLFRLIKELADQGTAVLYVSHRLDEVMHICHSATILRDGVKQATISLSGVDRRKIVELITGQENVGSAVGVVGEPRAQRSREPKYAFRVRLDGVGDDLEIGVGAGEILGVAGLDGSGRDSLPFALTGALAADVSVTASGTSHRGTLTVRQAMKHGIVLGLSVASAGSSLGQMTVQENLTLPDTSRIAKGGVLRRRAERALVGRWINDLDVRPRAPSMLLVQLSGGNRQKVVLARCLQAEPGLLVLNDPTAGVDVGARRMIYDILLDRAESGLSVLVCSSDLEDLASICTRVLCLVEGRLAAELEGPDITEAAILEHIVQTREHHDPNDGKQL
jgi:ribose transport system ATP-binding protein